VTARRSTSPTGTTAVLAPVVVLLVPLLLLVAAVGTTAP
jgi:hypothetical protein